MSDKKWRIVSSGIDYAIKEDETVICIVKFNKDHPNTVDNLLMLHAAPDMLQALELAVANMEDGESHCDDNGIPYEDYTTMKIAIDKAKGLNII